MRQPWWVCMGCCCLLLIGVSAQEPKPSVPPKVGLTTGEDPAKAAADLLKKAILDRDSGFTTKAINLCRTITSRYPSDRLTTPKAYILGAEILLAAPHATPARAWTAKAITKFRDIKNYQERMASLHRFALTRLTQTGRGRRPNTGMISLFLSIHWHARGLSPRERETRANRLASVVWHHWRYWERPGVELTKGGGIPPSGVRRIMEKATAIHALNFIRAMGKTYPLLAEVKELMEKRLVYWRQLWKNTKPNPRDQERFDQTFNLMQKKYLSLRRQHYQETWKKRRSERNKGDGAYSKWTTRDLEKKVRELQKKLKELQEELGRRK